MGDDEVLDAAQDRQGRLVGGEGPDRLDGRRDRGDGEIHVVEIGHGLGLGGVGEIGSDVGEREGVPGGGQVGGVDPADEQGLDRAVEAHRPDGEAVEGSGDRVGVVGVPDEADADLDVGGGSGEQVGQVEVSGRGVPVGVGPGPAGEEDVPLPGVGAVGEAGDVQDVLLDPGESGDCRVGGDGEGDLAAAGDGAGGGGVDVGPGEVGGQPGVEEHDAPGVGVRVLLPLVGHGESVAREDERSPGAHGAEPGVEERIEGHLHPSRLVHLDLHPAGGPAPG